MKDPKPSRRGLGEISGDNTETPLSDCGKAGGQAGQEVGDHVSALFASLIAGDHAAGEGGGGGLAQAAGFQQFGHGHTGGKRFPSALFLGYVSGAPLHVVAACDETSGQVFIITAYEPSLEIFETDYRTKRQP
ncbi:MAG: DUF4258 domain-containing protein [Verrucomicrobiota bacterium]